MDALKSVGGFLAPWEFSVTVFILAFASVLLYARGWRRLPPGGKNYPGRQIAFFSGCVLIYFVMQTRFDYLSQHMFFVHRLQHLVLHHLGPFLIAISRPQAVLLSALPAAFVERILLPFWRYPAVRLPYRAIQNPVMAPLLFIGLIFFWLIPDVHFDAMLNSTLYSAMNWSMLVEGLLFWFLMLDPRRPQEGALTSYGARMVIQWIAMVPQIVLGAYIALSDKHLYDIYSVCGRAWDMNPGTDQTIGGLITWIPASMMHVVGFLFILGLWMRTERTKTESVSPIVADSKRS